MERERERQGGSWTQLLETILCPAISPSACSGHTPRGLTSPSGGCRRLRACGRRDARRRLWPPLASPLALLTAPRGAVGGGAVSAVRRSRRAPRTTRSGRRRTTPRAARRWRASPSPRKVRYSQFRTMYGISNFRAITLLYSHVQEGCVKVRGNTCV